MTETSGPQVLWLRIGNSTNPALFQWLEPLWADSVRELRTGQGLVEAGERTKHWCRSSARDAPQQQHLPPNSEANIRKATEVIAEFVQMTRWSGK